MLLIKALMHALILCGLLNLLAPLVTNPGGILLRDAIAPAAFTIFSGCFAGGLHRLKMLVLVVYAITGISAYNTDVQELARRTIPAGLGVLLGGASRSALRESNSEVRTNDPRSAR